MRQIFFLAAIATTLTLTGCHSRYIATTIANHNTQSLTLVELDYPSASFGTQTLPPGQDFHYRFKILGSGPTAILWTDAAHKEHKAPGPELHEGQDGSLHITFEPNAPPAWTLDLIKR